MTNVAVRSLARAGLLLGLASSRGSAQGADSSGPLQAPQRTMAAAMKVPFSVGEKLEYDVKFGAIKVGSGRMEVLDMAEVRGHLTWHTIFRITGGIPFFRVNDRMESWFDVKSLISRRFYQDLEEGNYKPKRHYEFFPERGMYQENKEPEQPTVAEPLDMGSILYFVRTIPLDVGKEYEFARYFDPAGNPVKIKVLRRETIDVPAGKFNTVVLQPTIRTKGMFGEDGRAEIWISDDDAHVMVQMKSHLSFGSLNLYLRKHNSKAGTQ